VIRLSQLVLSLPTWTLIRVSGILAYLFLFAGMSLGILYSFPQWKGSIKASLMKSHTFANNAGTLLALLHAVILIIDIYMPFQWSELLIPFSAAHKPLWNGLGTLAAYGLLLLIFTTDIRNKMKRKVWRVIHLLSYPIFIMVLLHGIFTGTDTANVWIKDMYLYSTSILVLLTLIRFGMQPVQPKKRPERIIIK
jgi:methionine sulfoxide reductase heme-binding subunit